MKMKPTTARPFNLIEIVLAMAIVGVGVASVIGMFPVAIQASKDSIAENYSADAADQMLAQIERMAAKDWTIVNSLPDSTTVSNPSSVSYANWTQTQTTGTNIYDTNTGTADLNISNGILGILQKTGSNVDFAGHIKIWKSHVTKQTYNGTSWTSAPADYTSAARINIEISWPVEKPYLKRNTRLYCLDVFNND